MTGRPGQGADAGRGARGRQEFGRRHRQFDPDNRATDTVWKGRPDLYHAYQRALYAGTPLERGLAASARLDPNA